MSRDLATIGAVPKSVELHLIEYILPLKPQLFLLLLNPRIVPPKAHTKGFSNMYFDSLGLTSWCVWPLYWNGQRPPPLAIHP